jgi:hypothetical protein
METVSTYSKREIARYRNPPPHPDRHGESSSAHKSRKKTARIQSAEEAAPGKAKEME